MFDPRIEFNLQELLVISRFLDIQFNEVSAQLDELEHQAKKSMAADNVEEVEVIEKRYGFGLQLHKWLDGHLQIIEAALRNGGCLPPIQLSDTPVRPH